MGHLNSLAYLGLVASDLDAWEHFATDILGMSVTREVLDGQPTLFLRMDERHYRISIQQGPDALAHLGWDVTGPEQFEVVMAALEAAGVSAKEDPGLAEVRGVRRLLQFTDPAGVTAEVSYGGLRPRQPFVSPTGARFVTQTPNGLDLGLGHAVLQCPDPDRAMAFYQEILGFKVSDYIIPIPGLLLTFLRTNPRHHSLAIAPSPDGSTKLNHFMVEVADLDTVGRSLDKVHQQKIREIASIGRHSNDKMLSFYCTSPSDFGVEYGTQGLLVDEDTWSVMTYDAAEYWGHERDWA